VWLHRDGTWRGPLQSDVCCTSPRKARSTHKNTPGLAGKRVGHAFLVPCAKFMNVYHSIRVLCVYACAECNT